MKIALAILMVFCLIVIGFAVLPGAVPDSYDHFLTTDESGNYYELGNPVYDFGQTVQDSVGFFQTIGNFFEKTFKLFHPEPKPTGFMIRSMVFDGENGPEIATIIMYCDADVDLGEQLRGVGNFFKVYAYSGPDEYFSFFQQYPYFYRAGGRPDLFGYHFMTPAWAGNKLVGTYKSSLVPSPTTKTINSEFSNFNYFAEAHRYNMVNFSISNMEWRLVGN